MSARLAVLLVTSFIYLPYRCTYCRSMLPISYLFKPQISKGNRKPVSPNIHVFSHIRHKMCFHTVSIWTQANTSVSCNRIELWWIQTHPHQPCILLSLATQWYYFFFPKKCISGSGVLTCRWLNGLIGQLFLLSTLPFPSFSHMGVIKFPSACPFFSVTDLSSFWTLKERFGQYGPTFRGLKARLT